MEWYYEKDGVQKGPIQESELKALHDQGAITSGNLVWREGMADWSSYEAVFNGAGREVSTQSVECPTCGARVAASELIPAGDKAVCPNCRDEYAQGLREGLKNPVRSAVSRGTGGMTPNGELRAEARAALSGYWLSAVGVVFLFQVVQQGAALIPIAGPIIQLLISGALTLGLYQFFMGLNRDEPVSVGTLFNGFSMFGQGLGIYFVMWIMISLAAIAAAIPGGLMMVYVMMQGTALPENDPIFIAGIFVAMVPAMIVWFYMFLRYSLAFFIANDTPELGVIASLKQSAQMMQGRKGKLFFLYLSFIGWHFLGILALGIGMLWSMSYMFAASAAFYDDLKEA